MSRPRSPRRRSSEHAVRPCGPAPAPGAGPGAHPAPALLELLERLGDRRLRVLVPRAGAGRDAYAWAAAGHEVVAVEHAGPAAESCRLASREIGVRMVVLTMDLLCPHRDLEGEFDAIWERSCFCELPAHERERYVRAMAWLLRPGGRLYGVFTDHGGPSRLGGSVTEACVRSYFQSCFDLVTIDALTPGTAPQRQFMAVMRRKGWRTCRWRRAP